MTIIKRDSEGVEIEDFIGESTEGIEASIDVANMAFVFEAVVKMYSDTLGSFIREITTNCFDSHIEAGQTKPIEVSLVDDEDEGLFITFRDFGVGISEDRMANVYSKWFSSTKRATNDQQGMWGLGSKSPLGYRDDFSLITCHNGTEYYYLVHRGTDKPRIELIYSKATDSDNGTLVKVQIKEETSREQVIEKIKAQLSFFSNIVFVNCGISNDYTIYETENFKYRNDFQFSQQLHLCVDEVTYNIDFNLLGIAPLMLPVALKFKIGELEVNLQRESIKYKGEAIEVIKNKLSVVIKELISLYEKQAVEDVDIISWIKNKRSRSKFVTLDEDVTLCIDDIYVKRKLDFYSDFKIKEFGFEPLKDYNIPDNPFKFIRKAAGQLTSYNASGRGRNGAREISWNNYSTLTLDSNQIINSSIYFYNKDKDWAEKDTYIEEKFEVRYRGVYSVKQDKLSLKQWAEMFELNLLKSKELQEPLQAVDSDSVYDYSFIQDGVKFKERFIRGYSNKLILPLGFAKYIYFYKKFIWNYLKSLDNFHDYLDEIPESWKINKAIEKARLLEEARLAKKTRIDIPVLKILPVPQDYPRYSSNEYEKGFDPYKEIKVVEGQRDVWLRSKIDSYKGLVVYGFQKDRRLLDKVALLIYNYYKRLNPREYDRLKYKVINGSRITTYDEPRIKIIQISETNKKHLQKDNAVHIKQFLQMENRIIKKIVSGIKLRESFIKPFLEKLSYYEDVNIEIYNSLKFLSTFESEHSSYHENSLSSELRAEFFALIGKCNIHDAVFDEHLNKVEEYFSPLKLLAFTSHTEDNMYLVIDFIKTKKKRLNFIHYVNVDKRIMLMLREWRNYCALLEEGRLLVEKVNKPTFKMTSPYNEHYDETFSNAPGFVIHNDFRMTTSINIMNTTTTVSSTSVNYVPFINYLDSLEPQIGFIPTTQTLIL
jgi:hypothetical protein